jgi:hypothetical protein
MRGATKVGKMGNGYGSEFQLVRYLVCYRYDLNRAVEKNTGRWVIDWLESEFDFS